MKKKPLSLLFVLGIPFLVLIGGFSTAAYLAVERVPSLLEELDRGVLPAGFEVTIPAEGAYTVWLHTRGRFGDRLFEGGVELPPAGKVFLFDSATGQEIPLKKGVAAAKNRGEESAVSLGMFEGKRAGQVIEFKGSGLESDILISVSPTSSAQIVGVVAVITMTVLGTLGAAMASFLILMMRRRAALKSS